MARNNAPAWMGGGKDKGNGRGGGGFLLFLAYFARCCLRLLGCDHVRVYVFGGFAREETVKRAVSNCTTYINDKTIDSSCALMA